MIADPLLAGCVTSGGVLLVVAGAGKAYAGVRRRDGGDAIRRALHLRRGQWRAASAAAAVVECCTGTAVCAGLAPVPACAAMAALGAVFCALLGYVRVRRVPGGCGCLGWAPDRPERGARPAARLVVRAGLLAGAGLAGALNPQIFPNGQWTLPFYPGLVLGLAALAGVSAGPGAGAGLRAPACRRPLWRPRTVTAAALADSGVFQAMAAVAGPFGEARHRRDGCADEFLFPAADGAGQAVLFRVTAGAGRGGLAVHATVLTGWSS